MANPDEIETDNLACGDPRIMSKWMKANALTHARICFRFLDGDAFEVEITDHH